jgi:cobyrinic acid a,c-diamide synthase
MIPLKADEAPEEKEGGGYGEIMADRLNSETPMTNNIKKFLQELEVRLGHDET